MTIHITDFWLGFLVGGLSSVIISLLVASLLDALEDD